MISCAAGYETAYIHSTEVSKSMFSGASFKKLLLVSIREQHCTYIQIIKSCEITVWPNHSILIKTSWHYSPETRKLGTFVFFSHIDRSLPQHLNQTWKHSSEKKWSVSNNRLTARLTEQEYREELTNGTCSCGGKNNA